MIRMKGVSPIISTVLMILVAVAIAAFVGPWSINLATTTANTSSTNALEQMDCQNTYYDFATDYGNHNGVNITSSGGAIVELKAKIENTGTKNVYGFSFQLSNSTDIYRCDVTSATQRTSSDPLRPGEEGIIEASLTGTCSGLNDTITKVKVLNSVCSRNSPSLEI